MRSEELGSITREDATHELASGDRDRIARALIRLALHEPDRAWLEELCLEHMRSEDPWVRGVAATALGHVARLHHAIDLERVVPALNRLADDAATAGRARDALEDIDIFVLRRHDRE